MSPPPVQLAVLWTVLIFCTVDQQSSRVEALTCHLPNGTKVPDLYLGQQKRLKPNCCYCTCMENGRANCTMPACATPRCWDPFEAIPGFCCPTCPEERKCKTPGGTLMPEGTFKIEDGKVCTCSNFTLREGSRGPAATCAACRLENGTSIEGVENPGDVWKSDDTSEKCTCQASGLVTCDLSGCPADGDCCMVAHEPVEDGETVQMTNGTRCSCSSKQSGGDGALTLSCYTPTEKEQEAEKKKLDDKKVEFKKFKKKIRTVTKTYKNDIRALANAVRLIKYPAKKRD